MPDRRRSYALMPSSHGHVNGICSRSVLRASLQGLATNAGSRCPKAPLHLLQKPQPSQCFTSSDLYPFFFTYDDNRAVFNDKLTSRNRRMRIHRGTYMFDVPFARADFPRKFLFLLALTKIVGLINHDHD